MVLAEKGSENARNGRRSRGPSPNGHVVAESTSEDESVPVDKIRVGRDYQAVCPPLQPIETRRPDTLQDRALLVWSPTVDIPETKLDEYITLAKEKYGYNGEQALGMLFWHKHDLERAVLDLANFTPFPDEWSVEDKVLFEQAFQFHGKSFHRIRQMLPDKSIASLVKYYYSWKKTRTRTSLMDKQARKLTTQRDGGVGVNAMVGGTGVGAGTGTGGAASDGGLSDGGTGAGAGAVASAAAGGNGGGGDGNASNDDSDTDDKKWTIHRGIRRKSGSPPHTTATTTTTAGQLASSTTNTTTTTTTTQLVVGTDATTTTTTSVKSMLQGEGGVCGNCGVACSLTHVSTKGQQLCHSCFQHWRRTGMARPTSGPGTTGGRGRGGVGNIMRHKRRPPRGMYINHDDLVAMAASPHGQLMLRAMDREIISLKRQVQHNKQIISTLKKKTSDGIQELQPLAASAPAAAAGGGQLNARWTQDELLLAVQGVRKYGKDFKTIADVIGTKTESHLRSFFTNYRKRYNLDEIIKDYELEHGNNVASNANNNNNHQNSIDSSNNGSHSPKMEVDGVKQSTSSSSLSLVESMDVTSTGVVGAPDESTTSSTILTTTNNNNNSSSNTSSSNTNSNSNSNGVDSSSSTTVKQH